MIEQIEIMRIERLDADTIAYLVDESLSQGFRFVERLVQDYLTGKNRFDKTGEALFGVFFGKETIALGGLNQNPYVNPTEKRVGRLRHVYVISEWRRKGIGRLLVEQLIEEAISFFDQLTLRTDTSIAAKFYQKLGFQPASQWQHTSHVLDLAKFVGQ